MTLPNHDKEIRRLVEVFRSQASQRPAATAAGDSRAVNRIARTMHKAFLSIIKFGESGRDALIELTDDNDKEVSSLAALYSLRHDPERCKAVLNKLSNESGLLGFGARQSLLGWETGRWSLEPDYVPPTRSDEPVLADTGLGIEGLHPNEVIEKLATRDDSFGDLFRGIKERANMTDEQLIEMMANRRKERKQG